MLGRCVRSILASDHDSFEVIVVDQSEEPAQLPDDPRLVYIASTSVGKSAGLNVGLAAARSPTVAFTDDDCTVPSDWLAKAEMLLERHSDVGMAFGELTPIPHDPSEVFVPAGRYQHFEIVRGRRANRVEGGPGANMISRRSVFDAIGTWDELIGPGSRFPACEEWDMYYRALAAGIAVAKDPDLVTIHWGARPYADGSGRRLLRAYAYGQGAVMGKHLRLGDLRMLGPGSRLLLEDLRVIVQSLRHRRLAGVGVFAHKLRGIAAGLLTPVDRRRHVFRAPVSPLPTPDPARQ
jgi:glycosyltransferase involved in cell wall biosynthesis